MALIRLNAQSAPADTFGSGNVKERISILADGGTYTYSGTTYTAANVTAAQALTVTHATANGSEISYVPPTGTVAVDYTYMFFYNYVSPTPYSHFRFMIDSDVVTDSRTTIAVQSYKQDLICFNWLIPIGGSADTATGRQATWTSAKTLKVTGRDYGDTSHNAELHETTHMDGVTTAVIRKPTLILTALGS